VIALSRFWTAVIVAALLGDPMRLCAHAAEPEDGATTSTASWPETWPDEWQSLPEAEPPAASPEEPFEEYDHAADGQWCAEPVTEPQRDWLTLKWLGLRHSHTHGRHVGRGKPFVGTSWRNRPYYLGGELGGLWFTRSIDENITRDADAFGGVFAGWDWDHYWGSELRLDWSTPELKNTEARDAQRTDSLFTWSYSYLYYPWGDAKIRPYWRCGIGNTHFDYPLDDGERFDDWALSFPIGFGVKYPVRRWLAARAEFNDHFTVDNSRLETMHNLTFTLGFEWHLGAHPPSYWPWNPKRHIW
jgi:hypothetical protein